MILMSFCSNLLGYMYINNYSSTGRFDKVKLCPGSVAAYDIWPGNKVGLFWDTHTFTYLLTFSGPTRGVPQEHKPTG